MQNSFNRRSFFGIIHIQYSKDTSWNAMYGRSFGTTIMSKQLGTKSVLPALERWAFLNLGHYQILFRVWKKAGVSRIYKGE